MIIEESQENKCMSLWEFLNQNFISSIITAILFSIIISSYLKKRENKERLDRLFDKLGSQFYIEMDDIKDHTNKILSNFITLKKIAPVFFPINALKLMLSSEYISYLDLEALPSLVALLGEVDELNSLYFKLDTNSPEDMNIKYINSCEKLRNKIDTLFLNKETSFTVFDYDIKYKKKCFKKVFIAVNE